MADGEGVDDGGAAQAFDELRGEITLLRRAIERLTAERADDGHAPDYSETLGVIAANITATTQRVDVLVKSPALSLTPHEIGQQILEVGVAGRSEDRRAIGAARQVIEEVASRLGRQLKSHVMADEQQRRVRHVGRNVGLIGLVAGALLWAILASPIARFMPANWLLPERMAARSLRMPMWEGGQRLMRAGDPQAFAGVLAANQLATTNRGVLEACRKRGGKAKTAVRCTIEI
jgi:tetrahydromethanopterin S-methyltransferase subunit G